MSVRDETKARYVAQHGQEAYDKENQATGELLVRMLKTVDGYTLAASGNAALMMLCAIGLADNVPLEDVIRGVREAWSSDHVQAVARHIRGNTLTMDGAS